MFKEKCTSSTSASVEISHELFFVFGMTAQSSPIALMLFGKFCFFRLQLIRRQHCQYILTAKSSAIRGVVQ